MASHFCLRLYALWVCWFMLHHEHATTLSAHHRNEIVSVDTQFIVLSYFWQNFARSHSEKVITIGSLIDNFKKGAAHVAYVQIADSPDRHQPGTGELNYVSVLQAVRDTYKRPIGLELWAKDDEYDAALKDVLALSKSL